MSNQFWKSLVERVIRTFIQAFAASWALAQPLDMNVATWKYAVVGSAAAGVTAVMGLAAKPFGNPNSPSVLKPVPVVEGVTVTTTPVPVPVVEPAPVVEDDGWSLDNLEAGDMTNFPVEVVPDPLVADAPQV